MGAKGAEIVWCETCEERGRRSIATRVNEKLRMCEPCFSGEATCKAETVGGIDAAKSASDARSVARNRQRRLETQRRWRRNNSESIRKYQQRYRMEISARSAHQQAASGSAA